MFLLLPLLLALSAVVRGDEDPCNITTEQVFSFDRTQDCFKQVLLDVDVFHQNLAAVRDMMEAYVLRDSVRGEFYGYHKYYDIDLDAEWARINATNYTYDYEYHDDISKVLASLNDFHTYYRRPTAYAANFYFLPFALVLDYDDNSVSFELQDPIFSDVYFYIYGLNITGFGGRRVKKVNGLFVLDYLKAASSEYAFQSKDPNARFNAFMNSSNGFFESFMLTTGWFLWVPDPSELVLEFDDDLDPKVQNFSFFVVPFKTWNGTEEFVNAALHGSADDPIDPQPDGFAFNSLAKFSSLGRTNGGGVGSTILGKSKESSEDPVAIDPTPDTPSSDPRQLYIFENDTMTACIIRISEFYTYDETNFKDDIESYYNTCSSINATHIVFDLRRSGGDGYALAYWLFDYVSSHSSVDVDISLGMYDFRHCDLNDAFFFDCGNDPTCFLNNPEADPSNWCYNNGTVYTSTDWYSPGVVRIRGGVTSTYSNLVCPSYSVAADGPDVYYDSNHTLILSDGLCTSACAVFASKLMAYGLTMTIAVGGIPGIDAMAVYSSPGGYVLTESTVRDYLDNAPPIYADNLGITLFSSDQTLNLLQSELYSFWEDEGDLVEEFRYHPADKRLLINPYQDDTSLYSEALKNWPQAAEQIPSDPDNLEQEAATFFIVLSIVVMFAGGAIAAASYLYYIEK